MGHPSGAGLVRIGGVGGENILTTSAAGPTYSGVKIIEGYGMQKWLFQLTGTFTGYSVSIFGTTDPAAVVPSYPGGLYNQPGSFVANPAFAAPASNPSWFLLPSPSDIAGAGTEVNPLVAAGTSLYFQGTIRACCAVATGTAQTGTVNVLVTVAP
jgi:hypothetical protein